MDKNLSQIQKTFDSTIKDANIGGIIVDISEISIDSLLDEGVLKDVPVIRTIVALAKTGINIQDKLFLKKIISFINGLGDVPVKKRAEEINKIDDSKKYRIKVGEKLLYILDSCDDYVNSELIAKLFKAFLEEVISYDEFLKSANIIKNIIKSDLDWFLYSTTSDMSPQEVQNLIGTGLFTLHYEQVDVHVEDNTVDYKHGYNVGNKYSTSVQDGGVSVDISDIGVVIKKILFSQEKYTEYKKK